MCSFYQQQDHTYNIGIYLKVPTRDIWENSFANEIGSLLQGVGTIITSGTNTILFIPKGKVLAGRTVTYGRIVDETQLQKDETHCTQLTVCLCLCYWTLARRLSTNHEVVEFQPQKMTSLKHRLRRLFLCIYS